MNKFESPSTTNVSEVDNLDKEDTEVELTKTPEIQKKEEQIKSSRCQKDQITKKIEKLKSQIDDINKENSKGADEKTEALEGKIYSLEDKKKELLIQEDILKREIKKEQEKQQAEQTIESAEEENRDVLTVENSRTFDELYTALESTHGVKKGFADFQGPTNSSGQYGAEGFKWLIERVRNEKNEIRDVPVEYGVREKVEELLRKEKENPIHLTRDEWDTHANKPTDDPELTQWAKEKGFSFEDDVRNVEIDGEVKKMRTNKEDFGTILTEEDSTQSDNKSDLKESVREPIMVEKTTMHGRPTPEDIAEHLNRIKIEGLQERQGSVRGDNSKEEAIVEDNTELSERNKKAINELFTQDVAEVFGWKFGPFHGVDNNAWDTLRLQEVSTLVSSNEDHLKKKSKELGIQKKYLKNVSAYISRTVKETELSVEEGLLEDFFKKVAQKKFLG